MSDMLAELSRLVTVVYVHLSVTKWFYSLCILVKKVNSLAQFWIWTQKRLDLPDCVCDPRSYLWLGQRLCGTCLASHNPQMVQTTYGSLLDTTETQHVSCSLIWNFHHISWKSFDFISLMLCYHLAKQSNWLLDHNSGVHPGHQTPCLAMLLPRGPGEECSLKHSFRYLTFGLK